jgi:predicted 3-demethylubiquinone-9 3-methyltransferase (glyoxalase superfamily)
LYSARPGVTLADIGLAVAKRAFDSMMTMKKIDVAAIKAARRG